MQNRKHTHTKLTSMIQTYKQTVADGDKGYKWIQVDTACIRATCTTCKRGITPASSNNAAHSACVRASADSISMDAD